jgi:hypothetical protein
MAAPPFTPSFGNRPDQLLGRGAEVASFLRGLAGPPGHPDRAILCLGQRGMGKTALLLEFERLAREQKFVPSKATASPTLLLELLEGLARNGAKWLPRSWRVAGGSVGALGFSAGLTIASDDAGPASFRERLIELSEAFEAKGCGIALLVDEVTATSDQIAELAAAYQDLVGEGRNVAIALAGLPSAVSAVLNDRVLTFLNRAAKIRLAELPVPEVMIHYARTLAALGKSIAPADLTRAAEATRGYPYLLQLVGYHLLEYVGDASEVSADAVDLAVATARRALDDSVFAPALGPLSIRDRAFLEAMADDDGPSLVATVATRLGVSAASAQQTRARLIGAGVVTPAGRGRLAFTLPYLAEHLADGS